MSYQVLARKYRPKNFSEVVGQEHVTQTLIHAIEQDRIHHAYLFCGVRGVGKTSLARIFAKALNCEKGPTPAPCEKCTPCLEIAAGRNLNVMEIDGASNTSVDNIRELREQVKYLPAGARYKIYIIDEVHMLSTSAFNALLKTLEEPPSHVIFFFATTEVLKIPITILSRCQRFDLRRIARGEIEKRLKQICEAENIKTDPAVLQILSRAADGSMRDAQSLLDMAINLGSGALSAGLIFDMLGFIDNELTLTLLEKVFQKNLKAALEIVQGVYNKGYDLKNLSMNLLEWLHDLVLLKSVGAEVLQSERTQEEIERAQKIITAIQLSELQIAFQITQRSVEDVNRSEVPKILFDILLVKLCHGVPFTALAELEKAPQRLSPKTAPESAQDWQGVFQKKPQLLAMLEHAHSVELNHSNFKAVFPKGSFWYEQFKDRTEEIKNILGKNLGGVFKVIVEEKEVGQEQGIAKSAEEVNRELVKDDAVIQEALHIFNAKVERINNL